MKNLSNNNLIPQSNSPYRLLLFVLLLLPALCIAQPSFNRKYTQFSYASFFHSVQACGNKGGFMTVASTVDSGLGFLGIRISRFNEEGIQQQSHFFNLPDLPIHSFAPGLKAFVKIAEDRFAFAGNIYQGPYALTDPLYSFIVVADSNCNVLHYKEFKNSTPKPLDTVMGTADLKYDGLGHLITASHAKFITDTIKCMVHKFDTALNLVWVKTYDFPSVLAYPRPTQIIADSTGIIMAGGASNMGWVGEGLKHFKAQSFIVGLDTAGTPQWTYTTPTAKYTDYQGSIDHLVKTKDGGYLYLAQGHAYNTAPDSYPTMRLAAKGLIVKLDAGRNKLWDVELDKYFSAFGSRNEKIIELADSSFIFCGPIITDSTAPNYLNGIIAFQHYTKDGSKLYDHTLSQAPRDVTDTSSSSGGPVYDFCQTADKGWVMCGYYLNYTTGAELPKQRGWLIKLDSNGCEGPGDPQCWPVSIPDIEIANTGFNIYPNPSNGNFLLESSLSLTSASVKVYDLFGRTIYQSKLSFNAQQSSIQLNAPNGIYILELTDAENHSSRQRIEIRN